MRAKCCGAEHVPPSRCRAATRTQKLRKHTHLLVFSTSFMLLLPPPRSCLFGPAAITHREERRFLGRKIKNKELRWNLLVLCLSANICALTCKLVIAWMSRGYLLHIHASLPLPPPVTVNKDYSAPVLAGGLMNTQALCSV